MKATTVKLLACSIFLLLLSSSAAWAKEKSLPEVSKDGLHLLKDTKARVVYALPGATLDPYTKVMILDCFVAFRDGYQHDYNMDHMGMGLSGQIKDKDIERIKKGLAEKFKEEFTEVLTKDGHAVVGETGPDVLLLRPAIINLDITAPDLRTADFRRVIVDSAGSMTLYMELYDSATSTLLARVIDPQADQWGGVANRATNTTEANRIIRGWAKLLSEHLGDVKQKVSE
jgi:hypothetical protein